MTRPYRTPEKIERAKALRRKVYDDRAMWESVQDAFMWPETKPYKRPTSNALVFALYNSATIHEDAD